MGTITVVHFDEHKILAELKPTDTLRAPALLSASTYGITEAKAKTAATAAMMKEQFVQLLLLLSPSWKRQEREKIVRSEKHSLYCFYMTVSLTFISSFLKV